MNKLTRVFRHVVGGGMLIALGFAAGDLVFSGTAAAQAGCGLQTCTTTGCSASYMRWSCNFDVSGCVTEECQPDDGGCGPGGECQT